MYGKLLFIPQHFPRPEARGIFRPQGGLGLLAGLIEKFIISLYFSSYYPCYKLIKMCTIKFSIELN